jgi:Tol biopolymer transport system component
VIASDVAFGWYPVFTWSPDGDYVAVVTGLYQAPRYFAVLSRSGGDPVLTFPLSGYAFLGVDWSPDGKTLAIGATAAWNSNNTVPRDSHIYILDTESGASERIVDGAFPSFSPDGDSLAFFRDEGRDDSYGVWTVDLADGTLTQISDEYPYSAFTSYASNMETRFTAAWSADGSRLAFLSPEPETTELTADVTYPRVCATYVANADGSGLVKVSEDRVTAPAWLPSGDLLAGTTVYDGTTLTSTTRTTGYFLNGRGLAKAGSVPSKWSGGRSSASADGKYGLMFAKGPGYPEYGWYVVKAGS